MELRHLRTFVAIGELLSFSKAATRLHITQPALTRQVQDLEHELRCSLFVRGSRSIALTPAGQTLLPEARRIVDEADAFLQLAGDLSHRKARTLRIAHYGLLMALHAATFVRRLGRRFPDLTIELIEVDQSTTLEMLRDKRCEAAFSGLPAPRLLQRLEYRTVWRCPIVAMLPVDHPLAKKRWITLEQLKEDRWAIWDESRFPGFGRGLVESCKRAGFTPRLGRTIGSTIEAVTAVSTGGCVSYVAQVAARLAPTGVNLVPFSGHALDMPAILAWPQDSAFAEPLRILAEEMDAADRATGLKKR